MNFYQKVSVGAILARRLLRAVDYLEAADYLEATDCLEAADCLETADCLEAAGRCAFLSPTDRAARTRFGLSAQSQNQFQKQPQVAVVPEVYLLPSTFPVSYRSAIARQLCARWQRPLPNVIEQLRQVLQPAESTLSDINLGAELLDKQRHSIPAPRETKNIENLDFTFAISETGWLEATLTLPALTQWLNELNQLDSVIQAKTDCPVQPLIKPDCFRWQHLHARCCFHLRVSEQQGMIKLSSASPRSPLQIVNPNPLPWDAQLQPNEPALKRYKAQIQTVMAIWDRLALLKGDRRVKQLAAQLDRLCDQTEAADRLRSPLGFWQQTSPCTLDPEAAAYQSSLRQLELSLVRIVQVTVKHALMEGLGAIAPQEL